MSKTLLSIAVLPSFVIFAIVIKNARAEKEPFKKVAKVFGISVASTIVAMILELIGDYLVKVLFESMDKDPKSMLAVLVECTFVVALVEEGCKYFSFKLMVFHDRAFDNTYDGVIYGAAAALGFATFENILYVFGGGIGTGILRAVLSVPMHACTGILMGYCFGISKYKKYNDIEQNRNPQRLAYVISILIHALYDFFLMANDASDAPGNFILITIIAILAIMALVYALMVIVIKKARRDDQPIYNRYYYEHLNGAYQDMRGKTSDKMTGSVPNMPMMGAPVNTPYGQPMNTQYGQPMNAPYGQPAQNMQRMPGAPVYGVPPMNYPNRGYPQYGANRNMQAGVPQMNGYGRPMQPNMPPYGAPVNNMPNRGYAPAPSPEPTMDSVQIPVMPGMQRTDTMTAVMDAKPQKVRFCGECGNRIEGEADICPICGSKL